MSTRNIVACSVASALATVCVMKIIERARKPQGGLEDESEKLAFVSTTVGDK